MAFPKLAGDLIDVAITHQKGGEAPDAKREANAILLQVNACVKRLHVVW